MTTGALPAGSEMDLAPEEAAPPVGVHPWRRAMRSGRAIWGGGILVVVVLICAGSLPWTANAGSGWYYDLQNKDLVRHGPSATEPLKWFGMDGLGRSILSRCLLGGVISLSVGLAAAVVSLVLGVAVGLVAGYRGGWVDTVLMRVVDILYGLPYILLVILMKIALEPPLTSFFSMPVFAERISSGQAANLVVLFLAIGLVSWLTMARVVRGQVLAIRSLPYIEACRAVGTGEGRIFLRHILPNLMGPIIVYATLSIPNAILQESFLSFLGVGVRAPLPTWGSLASDALLPSLNPLHMMWWMLFFPCVLLVVTLLSLNFLGDGLRDVFDPQRGSAKM